MNKTWKRMFTGTAVAAMCFSAIPAGAITAEAAEGQNGAVVLYTNDVHCAMDGYSSLAAYKAQLEADGYDVILIDAGDAIQGELIGAQTKGEAIVDLMNTVGYDFAVPGNHEFDFGMSTFLDLANEKAEYQYLSANFVDLGTGKPVFSPYSIVKMGEEDVAFVGIATPETYTKSTPAYFQNDAGEYIYTFSEDTLYDTVQSAVDDAVAKGADRVVAVGHLGIEGTTDGWKSTDVIANTTGIDAFIDGHAHETINGTTYKNENGEDVLLTSTGTKFANIGVMTLGEDGTESSTLVQPSAINVNSSEAASAAYKNVQDKIDAYNAELSYLYEKIGTAEVELTISNEDGTRRIRTGETNMGDFVADAYRTVTGADISLVNGGGIRASVGAGDVTRKSLMDVNPWSNPMCVIRATGQQILAALEHGARKNPSENGGFLQTSGLTYEIHNYLESPVITDDKDMYMGMDDTKERRVQNVKIGGEPIDPNKTYTVAGSLYTLQQQGDGFTMLANAELVQSEGLPADAEMLLEYFEKHLNGTVTAAQYGNPQGVGRITVVTERQEEQGSEQQKEEGTSVDDAKKDDAQKDDIQKNDAQSSQNKTDDKKESATGTKTAPAKNTAAASAKAPKTGDESDLYLWMIMVGVAAGSTVAVYRRREAR